MEWVAALRGQVIGLDTAPLIYFIEEHHAYLEIVRPFFVAMDRGELSVVTSTVTLKSARPTTPKRRGAASRALPRHSTGRRRPDDRPSFSGHR